jgi:hypothetical protein
VGTQVREGNQLKPNKKYRHEYVQLDFSCEQCSAEPMRRCETSGKNNSKFSHRPRTDAAIEAGYTELCPECCHWGTDGAKPFRQNHWLSNYSVSSDRKKVEANNAAFGHRMSRCPLCATPVNIEDASRLLRCARVTSAVAGAYRLGGVSDAAAMAYEERATRLEAAAVRPRTRQV